MAAIPAGQLEFLVVVPDKSGPEVRTKRLEVRGKHFGNVDNMIENGGWKMGGGLLNEVPTSDDVTKWDFAGSTVVVVAESKEAVIRELRKDIYATSGVWDVDNAQVYPFKCAFRIAC